MDLKDKCTVLVCSCDAYSDLWEPFFKLFSYYWSDCPFDIVLNTETEKYDYPNLNIKTFSLYKKGEKVLYGKRMLDMLNRIKTPYTLLLLDDFFLRKHVDTKRVETIVKYLDGDKRTAVFNFIPLINKNNTKSSVYSDFDLRPVYGPYKLNFQAAVWRTDALKRFWKKKDTPWSWELYGNMRTFSKKYRFYTLSEGKEPLFDYGYDSKGMGVYRGKWVIDTVEDLFNQHNISVDFSKRGIYDPNDACENRLNDAGMSNEKVFASSAGYFWYTTYLFWCVLRKVKLVDRNKSFDEYLESKNKAFKE